MSNTSYPLCYILFLDIFHTCWRISSFRNSTNVSHFTQILCYLWPILANQNISANMIPTVSPAQLKKIINSEYFDFNLLLPDSLMTPGIYPVEMNSDTNHFNYAKYLAFQPINQINLISLDGLHHLMSWLCPITCVFTSPSI